MPQPRAVNPVFAATRLLSGVAPGLHKVPLESKQKKTFTGCPGTVSRHHKSHAMAQERHTLAAQERRAGCGMARLLKIVTASAKLHKT